MREVFIKYFENVRMNDVLNLVEKPACYTSYGVYKSDNYISFTLGKFNCKVGCDRYALLFSTYEITVRVNTIDVYKDGWLHHIPKEMKVALKEEVKVIKAFNKLCKKQKVEKHFNAYKKEQETAEKRKKEAAFLAEQKELNRIFKA